MRQPRSIFKGVSLLNLSPESFFNFENVGRSIEELETPVPLIDIAIMENNLKNWQAQCNKLKINNRPHIKTHKLIPVAKLQIALGASGISVQKLGEAEVMADAGIDDIFLTYNVVGQHKLARLADLTRRVDISVVADHAIIVEGLSQAGIAAGRNITVLVECDTGGERNGVQSPAEACRLAMLIDKTPGLKFGGLMTYPAAFAREKAKAFIAETKQLLAKAGLECARVSTGGSKDLWDEKNLDGVTEYRAGTYVYFDRSLVQAGACSFADCAETVLTTIVSTPVPARAIIDAGSKALTSDLLGLAGYGVVQDLDMAQVYNVNEEHGYLDLKNTNKRPRIGAVIKVTPNHVCPVNNLFDKVVFVRGSEVLGAVKVDARGKVQ